MAISLNTVSAITSPLIASAEAGMSSSIAGVGTDPSPGVMLALQMDLVVFNVTVDVAATMNKSIGDSIKSIAQKTS